MTSSTFDPGGANTAFTVATGANDAFIWKLNASGATQWVRQIDTTTNSAPVVAIGANGDPIIAGSFSGNVDLDPGTSTTRLSSSQGSSDIFVARLHASDGAAQWVTQAGSTGIDTAQRLVTEGSGNAYVGVHIHGAVSFPSLYVQSSAGGTDAVVWKLDSLGAGQWAIRAGGAGDENLSGLAVDGSNLRLGFTGLRGLDLDPGLGTLPAAAEVAGTGTVLSSVYWQTSNGQIGTACYAAGTPIATTRGEVVIEALRPGDRVRLAGGGTQNVIWIGERRIDCAAHPDPEKVWPVRVQAGAFAPGTPYTDVWMSPEHAVFADGILIPIRYLVNGATIVQERVERVHYLHVELERHALLLAAGLAAESWLDCGNRGMFSNAPAGCGAPADPDLNPGLLGCCAPRDYAGPIVDAVRARLRLRAETCKHGWRSTPDVREWAALCRTAAGGAATPAQHDLASL